MRAVLEGTCVADDDVSVETESAVGLVGSLEAKREVLHSGDQGN